MTLAGKIHQCSNELQCTEKAKGRFVEQTYDTFLKMSGQKTGWSRIMDLLFTFMWSNQTRVCMVSCIFPCNPTHILSPGDHKQVCGLQTTAF